MKLAHQEGVQDLTLTLFRQRGQSLSLNIRKSVQSAGHRHPGVNRGGVILSL